ncbi:MAG TPA: RDD family protein [Usitatibacter sp.]|nr:RDD family protein [Usitatibacter sp.]
MIDTLRPVSLPEGVEITLHLAGPLARARAWLIDFMCKMVLTTLIPPMLTWLGKSGMGLVMIAFFAIWILYPIPFEALWGGATPGKKICGLAVVNGDGTPIGWAAAFLRNVMRLADMLPIGYAVGLASMMLDRQFRRLGDLAAGTVVIHRDAPRASKARRTNLPPASAPAVALTALEQRAVLDFVERRPSWSDERAAEIAELAAPLVQGLAGAQAVTRIDSVAAALVERK